MENYAMEKSWQNILLTRVLYKNVNFLENFPRNKTVNIISSQKRIVKIYKFVMDFDKFEQGSANQFKHVSIREKYL